MSLNNMNISTNGRKHGTLFELEEKQTSCRKYPNNIAKWHKISSMAEPTIPGKIEEIQASKKNVLSMVYMNQITNAREKSQFNQNHALYFVTKHAHILKCISQPNMTLTKHISNPTQYLCYTKNRTP